MHGLPANTTIITSADNVETNELVSDEPEDYSSLLTSLQANYHQSQYYWQVGKPKQIQGWILHLSVIPNQVTDLLNLVVPFLLQANIPFKIVRTRILSAKMINGNYGAKNIGKVVSIFPPTDQTASDLARELVQLTKAFRGPQIPTDFRLENIVYTRYGSFSPIWITNDKDTPVRHIYNENQELIPDSCSIPFAFPSGVPWPFGQITEPVLPVKHKLLNARYYLIDTIKMDFRGNVYKAIYFKKLWNIKACILKQARRDMITDENERDNSHRLRWQFDLCQKLARTIPLPKVFDIFVENDDTYLAIEFVPGKSLDVWLTDIYQDHAWFELSLTQQQEILDIWLQVIDILSAMHEQGLIHRDITPGNFIVSKRNRVIPIDLELAWSRSLELPSPPFQLGTPGYMSPQQSSRDLPTIKDDIFALGSLIMRSCTKLNPTKTANYDTPELKAHLFFFTRDKKLTELIADCLMDEPASRPDLETLKTSLISISTDWKSAPRKSTATNPPPVDRPRLMSAIQAGLNCLSNPKMLSNKGRWVSLQRDEPASEKQELDYSQGWHTGMSGPLWLLAIAKQYGFDISTCLNTYNTNWEYINSRYFKNPSSSNPSLYYGGAGIALALSEGLNCKLLAPTPDNVARLRSCFDIVATDSTLSNGISGQGLAMLHALPWLQNQYSEAFIAGIIKTLSDTQRPNGSWESVSLGLDNGISGVLWFLLTYLHRTSDPRVTLIVEKGLNWLISNKANKHIWQKIRTDSSSGWYNAQSSVDLTLLMIKSYEITGDVRYKEIAAENLQAIPEYPIDPNFTLDSGLARLGHLYLAAHRVLQSEKWLSQAGWITNLFLHAFIPANETEGYWYVLNNLTVTADLYSGNSGVIDYLIRYNHYITSNPDLPSMPTIYML